MLAPPLLACAAHSYTRTRQVGFFTDLYDRSRFKFHYGASFPGGDNANYLSAPDHADFDFSTTDGQPVTQFSVSFWKSPSLDLGQNGPALARTYLGQSRDAANSGGWNLGSGGSNGQYWDILFVVATNSSASTNASAQATATSDWSHCVVTYDGSIGTAALRCNIYLDGVLINPAGYTINGTLPVQFQNPSAVPFAIGREGFGIYRDAADVMKCVGLWKRVLSAAEVTALYNNGEGRYDRMQPDGSRGTLDDIPGIKQGLVRWWDLSSQNSDGTWPSSVGNSPLTATGTVTLVASVMELIESSPNEFRLYPVRNGTPDRTIPHFCAAPRYLPDGFGPGLPAMSYVFNHGLYCPAVQPFNFGTGDILEIVKHRTKAGTEEFTFGTANESNDTAYLLTGWGGGSKTPVLRIRDTSQSFDDLVTGNTVLPLNTACLTNWRILGQGGSASFQCRLSGVQQTLTINTGANKSFDDVVSRDNIKLSGLARTSVGMGRIDCLVGPQLVLAPGASANENLALERLLAQQYGIAIA